MPIIKPFKGVLFSKKKVKSFKNVVCPPYDIISPLAQEKLYKANPYNIIRLEFGKIFPRDNESNNRYTRAAKDLSQWLKDGVLVRDDKPAIYIHKQIYKAGGVKKETTGFFAVIKIGDKKEKTVLPHEKTLSKPKEDRLKLIKHVNANLSPIYTIYDDESGVVEKVMKAFIAKTTPLMSITLDGVTHKLWRLTDENTIQKIICPVGNKKLFIADGHHRFEVSCNYNEMVKASGQNIDSNHVLMFFTDIGKEDNVTIFATHRLLKDAGGLSMEDIAEKAGKYFDVKEIRNFNTCMKEMGRRQDRPCFAVTMDGKKCLLLILKKGVSPRTVIKNDKSGHWKKLDVAVLHEVLLKNLLSLKDDEDNIKYTRDAKEASKWVSDGKYEIAFFLNPTRPKQIKDVANAGDMMPQKSTYFYPKLLTGLVINKY